MTDRGAQPQSMWGGRFEGASDPLFRAFNDSLSFDWRLVAEDVLGSCAWASALEGAGVLSAEERARTVAALREVGEEAASLRGAPVESGAEDVHSWVESRLVDRVGALGKKLHTGRSRNDQVSTDLRLWTRTALRSRIREVRRAQRSLAGLARRFEDLPFPGYTHLQRAQPVLFAHWCLAYVEMLERDAARMQSAHDRAGECPLGSAALAGSAFAVDRVAIARDLGFDAPTRNSLDGVSDRDFVVESVAALALCAVHLSRLAEDLILYSSAEFGLVEMGDSVASGSSIMPQKKNPDALELMRGKTGRIVGALTSLLMTVKGTPMAYNKDLQEDKEPLFDAMDALSICLRMVPPVLDSLKVNAEACVEAAKGGYANATELADYLVEKGVPFRDAHDATGKIVRAAIARKAPIEGLTIDELRAHAPRLDEGVYARLSLESTLARRDVIGGTAPSRVSAALADAEARLEGECAILDHECALPFALRPARADDAPGVAAILNAWAEQGLNLPRTVEDLAKHTRDFTVATERGTGRVLGCGALVLKGAESAEIRSLAVDDSITQRGVGSAIVRRLCDDARRLGAPSVFVLTCSPRFFERLGFVRTGMDSVPGGAGESAWKRRDRSGHEWAFLVWEAGR